MWCLQLWRRRRDSDTGTDPRTNAGANPRTNTIANSDTIHLLGFSRVREPVCELGDPVLQRRPV
jgi:hypothetical protein